MPDPCDILLVEDNPRDAELTLRVFKKYRLCNRICVVGDGQEALDWMFATGPHADRAGMDLPRLVLLDLKLPKIAGKEVLRRLKADHRTHNTPVVVLTSSQEEADLVESYLGGVNSYIVKPVTFNEFVDAVRQLGMYWLLLNRSPGIIKREV